VCEWVSWINKRKGVKKRKEAIPEEVWLDKVREGKARQEKEREEEAGAKWK
jgi:hypothetical protein